MGWLADAADELRRVLVTLQSIDLWPPWDAAQTIVDAVAAATQVALEPPGPAPDRIEEAAAGWHRMANAWDEASGELATAVTALAAPQVWEGVAGDTCRSSLTQLSARTSTAGPACFVVRDGLRECATSMAAARNRHEQAYPRLTEHLGITWDDLLPWELVDHLRTIVEDVVATLIELIAAYLDAAYAVTRAGELLIAAVDTIDLPEHLVAGVCAVDQVNAAGTSTGATDEGPLRGSVAERARARLDALSPADRAAVQALLAAAPDDLARGWVLAALASGLGLSALGAFAGRLSSMTPEQRRLLDPRQQPSGTFVQPDGTTCGSSSLVYARMVNDPAYAMYVLTGYDPRTGASDGSGSPGERFAAQAQRMHDLTNGLTDHDGDPNGWWPQALGTSPGSAARQMGGGDGLSGVPGSSYDVHYISQANLRSTYDQIVGSVGAGHVVPLYVGEVGGPDGSGFHVVLVTGTSGDTLEVYEPSSGRVLPVSRSEFVNQRLAAAGLGWDLPIATVVP